MQYLPSKKIVTLMIVIILVGGFWLFLNKNSNLKNKNLAGINVLKNLLLGEAHFEYTDSDNDGLLDWEEKLFGTDPQNPDSNGDGTLDGEEFASLNYTLNTAPRR